MLKRGDTLRSTFMEKVLLPMFSKTIGRKLFGKTMKEAAKTATKKGVQKAATKATTINEQKE